jgi:hypothetical protein
MLNVSPLNGKYTPPPQIEFPKYRIATPNLQKILPMNVILETFQTGYLIYHGRFLNVPERPTFLTICGLFLIAEKLRVLAVSAHKRF